MKVQVRIEVVVVECADNFSKALRDVLMTKYLAHNRAVFAFDERVVIRGSRSRLGELNEQLVEQFGDMPIDILGTIVGVESPYCERELFQQ